MIRLSITGIFLMIASSLTGCSEDDSSGEVLLPSNLNVEVETEEGSGTVSFAATANDANFYNFYFGETENEIPTKSMDGNAVYSYSSSGVYEVTVQAHSTAEHYISEMVEVEISISQDTPQIPEEGYSTPATYEGMELVWQDEFEGEQLNSSYWTHEIGTGSNGWGNNELQYYRAENTKVTDGFLIIEARKENYGGREYTSSRIISRDKKEFMYGRIDIRAALPEGQGIWPALWMLGSSFPTVGWPASGELDIMEMIGGGGRENTVHGTIHWSNNGNHASYGDGYTLSSGTFNDEFHVFSIIWDENSIQWLVDDFVHHTADITPEGLSEFHQEFFFIFNVAVGGNWPGNPNASTTFPQRMIVDYVRVFQEP